MGEVSQRNAEAGHGRENAVAAAKRETEKKAAEARGAPKTNK